MKKTLLSTLAAAAVVLATGANAEMYTVGQLGYGIGDGDYKGHGIVNVGAGYHLNDYMRSDITVGWRGLGDVEFKGGRKTDVWAVPALANVYATMPLGHGFGVYGMGGLGMSVNRTDKKDGLYKGETKYNFAWNVGGGIDYKFCQNWSMDLGYRFTDLGTTKVKAIDDYTGKTKADLRSHDILLSARYYF